LCEYATLHSCLPRLPYAAGLITYVQLIFGTFSIVNERICLDSRLCEEHKGNGHEQKTQYFFFSFLFFFICIFISCSSSAPWFCISSFSNSSPFSSTLRLSAFLLPYYCPLFNILSVPLFIFFPSLLLLLYIRFASCLCYISSFTRLIPLFVLLKFLTCTLHAYGLNC